MQSFLCYMDSICVIYICLKNKKKLKDLIFFKNARISKDISLKEFKNIKKPIFNILKSILHIFFQKQLFKANFLSYQIYFFYWESILIFLRSAHSKASYSISFGDNIPLNDIYLHACYKIYILMLSVFHIHFVCMKVADIFASEYYTLLITYIPTHKPSLH